ncbi:hypothetical protein AHMF7605_03095 [Adhaeribacter arboris]|uniref:Uncharacterized protein n=1 Tax=Adhaeribacter arboris TaxID=2072846 RepID=A0A2T2YAQ9_9BACT|nr:hypothetical protein [Adhaeribacter arboris]PSR52583.1 hypothetical protein AHMF7605_03095 [Adhaeribacter arboris]
MKNLNLLLLYLLVCLVAGLAPVYGQETEEFDELQFDKILIAKSASKSLNAKFNIAGNSASLVKAFGPPKSKTIEFAEMDQVNFTVYRYPGAEISFYQDKVIYFRIKGPEFKVMAPASESNKFLIQVGNPISQLKTVYPKSYKSLNSDGVLFFLLYNQKADKTTKKLIKTKLEPGIGVFTTDGIITDIVLEE